MQPTRHTPAAPPAGRPAPPPDGVARGVHGRLLPGLILVCLLVAGQASAAEPDIRPWPAELTTLEQLARGEVPADGTNARVRVRGVVTYASLETPRLYLQDGTNVMLVETPGVPTGYTAGHWVEAEGVLRSRNPYLILRDSHLRLLGTSPLPIPKRSPTDRLMLGDDHLVFLVVRGYIRDLVIAGSYLNLLLSQDGRNFIVRTPHPRGMRLPRDWLDGEIEVRGMNYSLYDVQGRPIGFMVHCQTTNQLRLLQPGSPLLFERPTHTLAQLSDLPKSLARRVKVVGTVVLYTPDRNLFLIDGTNAARAEILYRLPYGGRNLHLDHPPLTRLEPGDRVEVIGVHNQTGGLTPVLLDGEYRHLERQAPPVPRLVAAAELRRPDSAGQLVRVTARLLDHRASRTPEGSSDRLVLEGGGHIFEALWEGSEPAPWQLEANTWIEATGVNDAELDSAGRLRPNRIRLRQPNDVATAPAPPVWSRPEFRPVALVGGGVICLAVAGFVGWSAIKRRQFNRLQASEVRFRALIDNSFDATLVLGADGSVKFLSPAGRRLLGLGTQAGTDAVSRLTEMVHPDDRERVARTHLEILATPAASRYVADYRLRSADGSTRYVESVGTNCLQVAGVEGLVVNLRDVTDRRKADESARRSEAITRSINRFASVFLERDTEEELLWDLAQNCISEFGFADCVVYLVDPASQELVQKAALGPKNPRDRVIANPIAIPLGRGIVGTVAVSGRAERIGDTSRDPRYIVDDERRASELAVPIRADGQILGVIDSEHPDPDFFSPEQEEMLTAVASLCANKLLRIRAHREMQNLNNDLEHRVAERTTALRDINARLEAEVFARERAESELRVALAAEKELGRLRGSFVSMVSHEFRTPLGAILSSTEILELYSGKLDTAKREKHFRTIHEAIQRMAGLVDEVLLFNRSESGRMEFRPGPVDPTALCRRFVEEVTLATSERCPITLAGEMTADGAQGDERLLRHILINLLDNAVKYSPPGRSVTLRIQRLDDDAIFIVRDEGLGIPEVDRDKMFTPFHRGRNSRGVPGTGLGMVIVKRCVDRHGGQIRVVSAEGTGTTVTVRLPLYSPPRAAGSGDSGVLLPNLS